MNLEHRVGSGSAVVRVPTQTLNGTWAFYVLVAAFLSLGTAFLFAITSTGGPLSFALALSGGWFAVAAIFVVIQLSAAIRWVEISPSGVTYQYSRKRVTVLWPDIRPPTGTIPGGWSPGSGVLFRDLPQGTWTGEALRVVTAAQARAIVDYPSGRTWAPSDGWMRAIHSAPLPFRQRVRQLPKWVKIGSLLVLFGLALIAVAVLATVAGIVPGCAFSSYSCPTPGWFNDTAYVAFPALLIGVISFCSGALGWKSPYNDPA